MSIVRNPYPVEEDAYNLKFGPKAWKDPEREVVAGGYSIGDRMKPQGYKDLSNDNRKGLKSFFAYGKRKGEEDAYQQAHLSVSGVPGVVNLAVLDASGDPVPFAPFEWGGRSIHADSLGQFKYVEKDYFQNTISVENERLKYCNQMVSLIVGQPAQNVIALFGYDFYSCLGSDEDSQMLAMRVYQQYLTHAGVDKGIRDRKVKLFRKYADAECSPEVMPNYGDNDPEWLRALVKLQMLVEFHPSAILFDHGHLDPTDASASVKGDLGRNNAQTMNMTEAKELAFGATVTTRSAKHTP